MTGKALARLDGDMLIYGCGTMAGAMLSRWLECGLKPDLVTAIRKSGAPAAGNVTTLSDSKGLTAPSLLILGVKPQGFPDVAADVSRLAGPHTLVISIMAGVSLEDLRLALPDAGQIVRAMPNMPVANGRGIVALISERDQATLSKQLNKLMAPLGLVEWISTEASFNLVTALTGCGPAFIYRIVGAMAGAAVRLGLDPDAADRMARAMVAGAALTMLDSDETPAAMAAAVASPGGMTQAGLDVLDSDGRLAALMADTLRAARERGRELAASARMD
ncbi:NAD(P)-binding domain-containing protein [Sphingomonas lacunae]|uniref:Pyrroline-5-carboxylate reductase n=2 Tax=Sphingomonas lacunae TaxID=2698828 RepID=A0A6M4AWS4_9SPHN|nr:NAD(P)-binding domain-containing protein [Sphingomonas lacunae]